MKPHPRVKVQITRKLLDTDRVGEVIEINRMVAEVLVETNMAKWLDDPVPDDSPASGIDLSGLKQETLW
jgi:hypothetical protein